LSADVDFRGSTTTDGSGIIYGARRRPHNEIDRLELPERRNTDRVAHREKLLVKEKELTRQRDALNADRRRLPMVG
jgi:hypothetical protein